MKVSIIILAKNGQASIDGCLRKACNQKFEHEYEVIVIDSGSTDRTNAIASKYPIQSYSITPEEFGFSKTRNLGASLASGEFLVYLSQDAEPLDETWLHHLTLPLFEDSAVGAVFGRHIPTGKANPVNAFRVQWLYGESRATKYMDPGFGYSRALFSFSNANAAIRRELLQRYPFQDEISFCEDIYFSKQLLINGHAIVYSPEAAVLHSHNHSIAEVFSRYFDIAIAYQKIGILAQTSKIEKEGKAYALEELKYLIKNGHASWAPYSLINNLVKYAGFKAGCAEHLLPLSVKKKISKYWFMHA